MSVVGEQSQSIDGISYTTRTFPASEGLVLLPRLINLIGEKAGALFFGASSAELASLTEDPQIVAALLAGIAKNAAEDKHGGWLIAKDLVRYTKADKIRIGDNDVPGSVYDHFDSHFAGRYDHLLNVCMWVAQASFSRP